MKIDAELNSETSSAAGEPDAQSHGKSPAATAPESEAAMPAAATSEGSPAGAAEDDQGKAVMTRVVEPSVEKGKSSAAAETGGDHQVGDRRRRSRRPKRRRSILSGRRWRRSTAGIMRRPSGYLRRSAGKTPRPLSRTPWRPWIARIMRRLRGFLRRSARQVPAARWRADGGRRLRRPPSPRHRCWVRYRSGPAARRNRNQ